MINNYNPVTMGGVLPPYWDSALIHKDVSGSIASFSDGADGLPLKSCVVQIEPVQAAGTPSSENPLPITGWTGCNIWETKKNVMECISANKMGAGVTVSNGVLTAATHNTTEAGIVFPVKPNTTYIVGFRAITNANKYIRCAEYTKKPTSYASNRIREILHEETRLEAGVFHRTITTGANAKYVMFGFYRSYSAGNAICDNWFANLAKDGNAYEEYRGNVFPIIFTDPDSSDPLTIYGGTVALIPDGSADVISTMGNIASYDGESLPGAWISSMDVYEEGATPTTGAQVVYELETPLTYHIENVGNLQTLLGVNNIWADTGGIDLTYYADTTLAHEAQTAELQALILEQ